MIKYIYIFFLIAKRFDNSKPVNNKVKGRRATRTGYPARC